MLTAFHKKGINQDNWPAVQFNAEETHLFLLVKSAVAVYDMGSDLTEELHKVKMENLLQYSVCPAPGKKMLASFVPESKGNMPAVIACNEWPKGGGVTNRKQFFRVLFLPLHSLSKSSAHQVDLCASQPTRKKRTDADTSLMCTLCASYLHLQGSKSTLEWLASSCTSATSEGTVQ